MLATGALQHQGSLQRCRPRKAYGIKSIPSARSALSEQRISAIPEDYCRDAGQQEAYGIKSIPAFSGTSEQQEPINGIRRSSAIFSDLQRPLSAAIKCAGLAREAREAWKKWTTGYWFGNGVRKERRCRARTEPGMKENPRNLQGQLDNGACDSGM